MKVLSVSFFCSPRIHWVWFPRSFHWTETFCPLWLNMLNLTFCLNLRLKSNLVWGIRHLITLLNECLTNDKALKQQYNMNTQVSAHGQDLNLDPHCPPVNKSNCDTQQMNHVAQLLVPDPNVFFQVKMAVPPAFKIFQNERWVFFLHPLNSWNRKFLQDL